MRESTRTRLQSQSHPVALANYRRDGFAVVEAILPYSLVATLRDDLDRLIKRLPAAPYADRARHLLFERDLPAEGRGGVPAKDVGDAVFVIGDLCRWTDAVHDILSNGAIIKLARSALHTDGLCAHFMNATIKHPRFGRAVAWHRDYPNGYIGAATSDYFRIMICLDGMAADGGATRFIAGSHAITDAEAVRRSGDASERRQLGPYDGKAALCSPGALVLVHPKVLHGSPINRSARQRRNIVLQVGNADMPVIGERESITGLTIEKVNP